MRWTVERVKMLTNLWQEGYSARYIAKKLGGVTRNAVIGKATRMYLERRGRNYQPVPPPAKLVPPPVLVLKPSSQPKEPWQCQAEGCRGTRQRPWAFCASCLNEARRPNARADAWDGIRCNHQHYTPLGKRGAA